ncbi:MAG: hypothetical protein JWN14_2392, partial [Chthonomonadales bacterium]|nr:hypothetical protein [Chthonomonadales bacterium]
YRGDARRQLAGEAWQYWEPTLWKPNTDRHAALAVMQRLLQSGLLEEEASKRMSWTDAEEASQRALVIDLEVSLAPSHAESGSIEAEIDALVDYYNPSTYRIYNEPGTRPLPAETDPRFKKLWLRGFEAVPILLKHLNDRRFTRTYSHIGRFHPSYPYRISHVVADLLTGLAGSEAAVGAHEKERGSGKDINPAKAEQWWKQARAIGEERYLLRHLLPAKNSEEARVNDHNAVLIAARYPRHLPALYREILHHYPHAQSGQLAQLLQESQRNSGNF